MNFNFKVDYDLNDPKMKEVAKKVLFDSMLKMQEIAKFNAPVDVGRLKGSINLYPQVIGFETYQLVCGADYGIHLEYGTSPHWVGVAHLKDWARRKLGDENLAYAVQKKIAKFGTDAHPFMRPALDQVKMIWAPAFFKEEMAKVK